MHYLIFKKDRRHTTMGNPLENEKIQEDCGVFYKKNTVIKFLIFVILLLMSIILCFSIIIFMYGLQNGYARDVKSEPTYAPFPPPLENTSGKLKIISRNEWLAQPPTTQPDRLDLPVPNVIILHTATENCTDHGKCIAMVRYAQNFHIESKGWWDISYHFLVGGDGYVYEGRGWKGVGANAIGWNTKSIGIAFIGTFINVLPSNQQILACKQLIQKGVNEGYLAQDYKVFAQSQLVNTLSPGKALSEDIKTWPHWAQKP